MKKLLLSLLLISPVFIFSGCSQSGEPYIKKSNTGICHEKGTNFYNNTKNFTTYNSIDDCLSSGGRLPKK